MICPDVFVVVTNLREVNAQLLDDRRDEKSFDDHFMYTMNISYVN